MYGRQSMFPPEGSDPRQLVRVMQIICGALMMGLLMFGVIASVIRFGNPGKPVAAFPIVSYLGAGFALQNIVLSFVIPSLSIKATLKRMVSLRPIEDLRKLDLYGVYQTRMIIGCALLEGAGFFNLVAVIIDGHIWSFAVVAILIALMAMSFPTYERVDAWADDQLRLLQLDPPH